MNKLLYSLIFVFLGISTLMQAQLYTTAVGMRIKDGVGVTVQQKVFNKKSTIEAILGTNADKDTRLAALYEYHTGILGRRFNFYTGAGLQYVILGSNAGDKKNGFGPTGIVGFEATFNRFNAAIDLKPTIYLSGGRGAVPIELPVGISVRYVLVERKKTDIEDWKVWDKFKRKK